MTDDVLPDFGRSDDMVLPVFDRGALAVAEQEQQRQRGEPNLPAPAYPPAVDLGFGGPARSQMTFGENVAGSFFTNTLPGVIGEAASNEAARGNAQPGGFQPSQLRNLPSRVRQRIEAESPEDAAARREAAYQRVFDQAAYDLSQSRITPQSVAGTVVGALADPVNVVSVPARVAIRGGEMALAGIRAIAPRLGRSETAARIAQSGVDAAITNTAIDPVLQAGRIQSGGQESYSPEQTALAPLVGGAAGAAIRGAIEAPSFARREAQVFGVAPEAARVEPPAQAIEPVGTEAASASARTAGEARIATPEAPIAREGQTVPDAGPVQRQAEAVSPEPVRTEAPAGESVARGAAVEPQQIAGVPDGGRTEAGIAGDAGRLPEGPARDQGQEAQAGGQASPEAGVIERDGIRFNDTRGSGTQLHGTSEPDLQPYGEHYSTKNYYGQGFYTTDAADVAYGYSRRGSQRTGGRFVYRVEETRPLRLLDGEAEIPANLRQLIEPDDTGRSSDIEDVLRMAFDEKPKNVRELYDNIREIGTGEGLSADTIQEIFDVVNYHTRSLGFDGMSHLGGLRTNTAPHRVVIYFNPESDIRVTRVDPREFAAPEPPQARVAANDAEPQQFAAMARNQDVDVRQTAREEIAAAAREDIAPMARQTADTTADRRFPGRQELPGEASKPRQMPEGIKPEDIRDFRVTELMRDIAARMDRKLEVDRNFSIRGAEGQYDFKQGVLRIRREGDMEVFSHELGHAIEQQIRKEVGSDLGRLMRTHAAELKRLDANTDDPNRQTTREGFAEFVRRLINNPAYAAKQAPGFAADFAKLLERAPAIRDIINDATLISRIDGGLDPVQSIKSTVAPAVEPRGVKKFMDEWRRSNLPTTLSLWADRAYAAVVDRGHPVKRFVQSLTEARYQKTGQPMPEWGWGNPVKMFRALDGAKQAAVDAFQNGVRDYGRALDGPVSPSLHAALKEAGGGSIGRMLDEQSEGYRDFNAYLIARRSLGEYQRFREGDLPSPPVRQTENEIVQAIAALEAANPTFRSAADKVFGFSRAMLRKKFEAGLVSKEFYDAVTARGMDYVPFFRDMMGDDARSPGGGGGSNGVSRGLEGQQFRGSTRDILDPVQSLMLDTARTERVIALNDFWTAMHRLAKQGGEFSGRFLEEIPNSKLKGVSVDVEEALKAKARERGLSPEDTQNLISSLEEMVGEDMTATLFKSQEISPGGERIVFRYEAGKRIAMKLGSDEYSRGLFEVMEGMSAAERDVMLAMFGKANAMFAQFITNAPEFALKNLVMDNLSRLFIARHTGVLGRVPFASLAQGIYSHIFDREFKKAYAAMGGIRGGVVSAASRDLERTGGLEALSLTPQGTMGSIKDMVGNVRTPADVLKAGASVIGKGVEGYFKLIEATETAGRLGQARFVFNHLKKQGLSDYEAMHAALYEARDVLDYDRRGVAMKTANRLMPFFNVGIQGIDRGLRNLVSDPLAAALQAYQRGGYANVDEAGKTALRDAVINWGMIAAAAVVTLGYHAAVSDDPVYRRQSDYMRKRYFILPMGQDASGRDYFISVPKPFDLPGGILSAVEAAADGIKRADPEAYGRVSKGLAEGFIPRQLAGFVEGPWTGFRDLFAAQPVPKVIAEAATGRRLGFEGSGPSDIVPMGLRGLMPADQWTGNTSFLAKRIGAATNSSPLMIDHVMNGLGATTARAFNDVITAIFDNNPNMTPKDATTRLFFNGLYRGVRGVGSDRSEVTQLMGRDGAKYMAPALSYAAAIERGDTTRSEQIYQSADSIGKALMTLRGHSFAPAERQLHPLQSAETWAATVGAITRDLSQNRIEVQNRSRRRGEQRETIDLEPGVARSIINTMNAMAAEEIRNGLSTAGIPGYQGLPVIDTKARLDAIRALNPQVADEIQNRITRAHIIPAEVLREKWPEVQRRLSTDRQLATLNDLLPAGASQAARRAAGRSLRTRQRVEESNNSD